MFIEGRTFSMSETAIQQIEYFDDCQDKMMRSLSNQLIESGTPKDEETRKVLPPPEDEGEYHYTNFPTELDDLVENSGAKADLVDKHPGIRTPMELKQVAQAALHFHQDDKFNQGQYWTSPS